MDAFELVGKLTLDSAGVMGGLNSAGTKGGFSAWGVTVGNLAAKAFSSTFSAATKFARSIFETGMDFDAQLSNVNSIKDFTEEQFGEIREKAIDLGRQTKYTATEVGEAFYYMGLAGWDSSQMLAGIEPVLNLAAASGENLGRASDIVTDALTAFGYTAEDTAMFVDVLAQASANSNTTVGMMGEAFKYLGPVAGSLNYSVQDVAVGLGLLANSGIKASQAGTSLRQILGTLENPSKDAAEAMAALGISLDDGTGKIKPFKQLISELRTVFQESDYDPKQGRTIEEIAAAEEKYAQAVEKANAQLASGEIKEKDHAEAIAKAQDELSAYLHFNTEFLGRLGDIGGLRGISSLLALMMSTDDDFDKLVKSIENSEGAAAEMRDKQIDNLKGDITLLNSALDGLKIMVSDEYKGKLRDFVTEFTTEVGKMGDAFQEGGLSAMFINLTDWVINGITGALSNPEITQEGANDFGKALGDFVGHLVAKLVTSAPTIVSGLFEAGMNLAGGLVEGLFAGLFGTGEGTLYGTFQNIEGAEKDAIDQANRTAVEATGIVNYMQTLVDKYGDAASQSGAWADSLSRLEQLIPGITKKIEEEGTALGDTTAQLKDYIEANRQKLVEDAKQATIGKYREQYTEAQVSLGQAQIDQEIASFQMKEAAKQLAQFVEKTYNDEYGRQIAAANADTELSPSERAAEIARIQQEYSDRQNKTAAEILAGYESGAFSFKDIADMAKSAANFAGVFDQSGIENLITTFNAAKTAYDDSTSQIASLTAAAELYAAQLSVAEAAVSRMSGQADSFSASELNSATSNAASSLNSFASRVDSASVGGVSVDGSNAKGDWYVPYDNYVSRLHRGEMVLTATQARKYRNNELGGVDSAAIAAAVHSAMMSMTMELNGSTVGRVVGDATTNRINGNIAQMKSRHRYGYGG